MTTATAERTTADLLLAWDATRPRSKQTEFGMSELGGCRRRAGYRLHGQEPTNPGGSVQAVMGTAIHDAVSRVLTALAEPGDLVEHEVTFAGILGHLDRYEAATGRLIDVKTTSSRWLDHIKVHGPGQSHRWQVNAYAAALISTGRPVHEVVIDYLARDTGEQYRWTGAFNPQSVRDALAWVTVVRETELDMLPRDYAPGSAFCEHCPFRDVCWEGSVPGRDPRSVLYVEDPDAQGWAKKLWQARQDKKDAECREDEARGALDALRPDESGSVVDVGWDKALRWTVTYPERLDTAAVKAEYAKAGAKPPVKVSEKPAVRLDFAGIDVPMAAPEPEVQR